MDWRIGRGLSLGKQIDRKLGFDWNWIVDIDEILVMDWLPDLQISHGLVRDWLYSGISLKMDCLNRRPLRHFNRSHIVLVPSALFEMSVRIGLEATGSWLTGPVSIEK